MRGQPALQTLVRSYAEGGETDAALRRALNSSMDDLQKTFDKALDDRFGAIRRALHDVETPMNLRSLAALEAAAAAKPDSYIAQLALGPALAAAGDPSACSPLQPPPPPVPPA